VLIRQVNDVLSTFRKLDPAVKIERLYRYCCSFYSSVLRDLQLPEIFVSIQRGALPLGGSGDSHVILILISVIMSSLVSSVHLYDELCISSKFSF
jgi:hypothetical protein